MCAVSFVVMRQCWADQNDPNEGIETTHENHSSLQPFQRADQNDPNEGIETFSLTVARWRYTWGQIRTTPMRGLRRIGLPSAVNPSGQIRTTPMRGLRLIMRAASLSLISVGADQNDPNEGIETLARLRYILESGAVGQIRTTPMRGLRRHEPVRRELPGGAGRSERPQ